MPELDPVAVYLTEMIRDAADCILLLPPLGAPMSRRRAAIDQILTRMEPWTGDMMLAYCDLALDAPQEAA